MTLTDDSHSLDPPSPSNSRPLRPAGPSHGDLDTFKHFYESTSTPTHDTPLPDGSPQIASSPDRSPSFNSWLPAGSHSSPSSSWTSDSWLSDSDSASEETHSGSLDRPSPDRNNPSLLSSGESYPPSPGQIDRPPPSLLSEPGGPSIRLRPPPSAESSEVMNAAAVLIAMSMRRFRPRTYGSGAVDAARGELLGTIDSRVYVSASPFPLLPTFKRPARVTNILTL